MNTQNTPITESTVLQGTPKTHQKETNPKLWQSVLVGGVPGILIGAGVGAGITSAIAKQPEEGEIPDDSDKVNETEGPGAPEIQVAGSVTDDMSFSEAFAAARNEVGPGGAFVWHGHVYGTYRGDDPEWQEMSDEARAEHSQAIIAQVHPSPYTPTAEEPVITPVPEEVESPAETDAESADSANDDVEVHVIESVYQGQADDGTVMTVGVGEVEGHHAEFWDTDGDGEVDTVLIDSNDNRELDEGERHSASGITVDDLAADAIANAQLNNASVVDDELYGDMPDYTNDADTSSYC